MITCREPRLHLSMDIEQVKGANPLTLSCRTLVSHAMIFLKNLKLILATCALCVATLSNSACAAVTSQTVVFFSKSLDQPTTYIAFLPDHFDRSTSYPVLYLLHGATGCYKDWSAMAPLSSDLEGYQMIVITPDGGQFGWYLDSPLKSKSQYESFITKDLIHDVDQRFPTIANRNGRGIAGLSMGGHGALSLAAKHPDLFSSASSLSGIVKLTNHPTNWHLPDILGPLGQTRPAWEANSTYELADRFTSAGVAILFDCGDKDATGATRDNQQLHERLTKLGVPHNYHQYPGGHTWAYWRAHLPEHLAFHAADFKKQ